MLKIIRFSFISLTIIAVIVAYYANVTLNSPIHAEGKQFFVVQQGASLSKIATELEKQKIIPNAEVFKRYAQLFHSGDSIKPGEYALSSKLTSLGLLKKMIAGDVITYNFTLIEGWTFIQIKQELANHPKLIQTLDQKSQAQLLSELDLNKPSLEGLFFADSYQYVAGMKDIEILKRANQQLQQVLTDQWNARIANLPYKTSYDALIMASIIEKETGAADERPKVAGVFVRRLQKKMRLQSDPTVIYGLGEAFNGNLTRDHLRSYSPYNTYQIDALPPTPIAAVGKASIHAALNPSEGSALYFVGMGNGRHYFSKTLQEHNNAVKRYQLSEGSR